MTLLIRFLRDRRGATAIEYSIIAVLVSIAGIAALMLLGPALVNMFNDAGSAL